MQSPRLDQSTFFRSVEAGNVEAVAALLKHRKVDVNEFNVQGMTATFMAVYNFEHSRSTEMARLLIDHGAKCTVKAASSPSCVRWCYQKHEHCSISTLLGSPHKNGETKKVAVANKTPLLLALELKSSLYLKGWEYRHWDEMLDLLAETTVSELSQHLCNHVQEGCNHHLPSVADGWAAVFASGKHETVEVWAEGQHVVALKLLLEKGSRRLKFDVERSTSLSLGRIDIHEASFTIARAVVGFLYTGGIDSKMMAHRGVDLLVAAHKLEVLSLKRLCEEQLVPTQDNWIQQLTAALECHSDPLSLKVAQSAHQVMRLRLEARRCVRSPVAATIHPEGGPEQLVMMQEANGGD